MGTDITVFFDLKRPVKEPSDYRFFGTIRSALRNLCREFTWVTRLGVLSVDGIDVMLNRVAQELVLHYDVPRPLSRDTANRMLWAAPLDRRDPAKLAMHLGHALARPQYVYAAFAGALRGRGLDLFGQSTVVELIKGGLSGQPVTPNQLESEIRRRFEERYGGAMSGLRVVVQSNAEVDSGTARIFTGLVV